LINPSLRPNHGIITGADVLVLTIGHLTAEASPIWVINNKGQAFPWYVVGYNHETGFGQMHILGRTNASVTQIRQSSEPKLAASPSPLATAVRTT
jgi:S1-C subfamily serine protease